MLDDVTIERTGGATMTLDRTFDDAGRLSGIARKPGGTTVFTRALRPPSGRFYAELPVNNTAGPVWGAVDITGVIDDPRPGTPDQVQTVTRPYFVPRASQTLEYDLDGNLTSDGQWVYSWDGENQLKSIETNVAALDDRRIKLEFVYDSEGRRAIKKKYTRSGGDWALSETRAFVWAGWIMVADLLQNGGTWAVDRRYYWGPDLSGSLEGAGGVGGLLWTEYGTNDRHGYCFDGNGNVVGLIDLNTGTVSARYERGPFGEPLEESGPAAAGSRFRFSTKYEDETGPVYYGRRCYHPELGRWSSRDPIEEEGGVHLYGFVFNDSGHFVDCLGLENAFTYNPDGSMSPPGDPGKLGDAMTGAYQTMMFMVAAEMGPPRELSVQMRFRSGPRGLAEYLAVLRPELIGRHLGEFRKLAPYPLLDLRIIHRVFHAADDCSNPPNSQGNSR